MYLILHVELENRGLETVIREELDDDQWKRYEILQDTKGGRPYLFNGSLSWGSSDGSGEAGIDELFDLFFQPREEGLPFGADETQPVVVEDVEGNRAQRTVAQNVDHFLDRRIVDDAVIVDPDERRIAVIPVVADVEAGTADHFNPILELGRELLLERRQPERT